MGKQLFQIMKADGAITGWIYTLTCIALCVYCVLCPPQGSIDGSVLAACSILLAFKVIDAIPNMIKAVKDGKQVIIHHKDTDVTIDSKPESHQTVISSNKDEHTDTTNINTTL